MAQREKVNEDCECGQRKGLFALLYCSKEQQAEGHPSFVFGRFTPLETNPPPCVSCGSCIGSLRWLPLELPIFGTSQISPSPFASSFPPVTLLPFSQLHSPSFIRSVPAPTCRTFRSTQAFDAPTWSVLHFHQATQQYLHWSSSLAKPLVISTCFIFMGLPISLSSEAGCCGKDSSAPLFLPS